MSFTQKEGTTRCVLVCTDVVIKIAKDENGRRGNLEEAAIWHEWCQQPSHPNTLMLCPVLWNHPDGHVIIMAKAEPFDENSNSLPEWDYDPNGLNIHDELKAENWGIYQGRVVVIDYARPE